MDVENTEHLLPNRISKEKRQYRNRCSNETRKLNHFEEKKNILKRIIFRINENLKILFAIKYRSSIKKRKKMKIQEKVNR